MTRLDKLAGEFIERIEALPGPKRLMILADHGFTRLRTELDVNSLLMREGYLSLDAAPASELDMRAVSESSRALALDPGRIYLHTRERFARGTLSAADADAAAGDITAMLENLTWDGRKVIRRVHRAEELYAGPCLPVAPDLVIEPEPGVNLTAKLDGRDVFGLHGRSGTHTADDALFYDSGGFKPKRMRDTGARVLDFFGLDRHNAGSTCKPDNSIITIR
jgi:predicted AlkP superfamily phosphohydrolase/phosphomutase